MVEGVQQAVVNRLLVEGAGRKRGIMDLSFAKKSV